MPSTARVSRSVPPPLRTFFAGLVVLVGLAGPAAVQAQPTLNYFAYIDSTPDSDRDQFGVTAADGDILAVGAPSSRLNDAGGTVHIFERTAPNYWTQTFVVDEFPTFGGNYVVGEAVSVSDGTVAVGLETRAEIALYSKASGTWARDALISTSSGVDCLVIEGDDLLSCHRGRVEHRRRQTDGSWLLVSSFVVASFTDSIDIEGDIAVIGDRAGTGSGSSGQNGQAFVAERDAGGAFRLAQRIIGSATDGYDQFGDAVAVAGDRVVVAAPGDEVAEPLGGALYVFERDPFTDEWVETDLITASDPGVARRFGLHLAWRDGRLLVANRDGDLGSRAAYLLELLGDRFVETAYLRIANYSDAPWTTRGAALGDDVAFIGLGPSAGAEGSAHAFAVPSGTERPVVTLDPVPACPTATPLTVTGSVAGAAVSSITGSVDGGFDLTLCSNCGDDPSFSYDAPLAACANTIRIDAISDSGFGAATAPVIFDTVAPSVTCPDDVRIMESSPNGYGRVDVLPAATASDACDPSVVPTCERDDIDALPYPGQPNLYREGTNGITCAAADACDRVGTCAFAVEVLPYQSVPTPDPDCTVYNLRDEVGGPVFGFQDVILGTGEDAYNWTNSAGVELYSNAAMLAPGGDIGPGFLYREITGGVRIETEVPDPSDYSEDPLGGLMLRWGVGALDPTAYVVYRPASPRTIEFGVRTAAGVFSEPLADPIPAFNINRLAIQYANGEVEVQVSIDNGNTWITPSGASGGSAAITTSGAPTWAGMVVSSQSTFDDASFIFPDITYCPLESTEPPPPSATCSNDDFEDDSLGSEWTVGGLGNANQVSFAETGGVLELTADGTTAFSNSDNGGFAYQAFTGDFRVEVTVDGDVMTTGGAYRKAGLMIRSSLDPWAPRVLANLVPYWNNSTTETHVQWVARQSQDGSGSVAIASDTVGVPRVVRLAVERTGSTFSVEYSTDGGTTWVTPSGGLGGSVSIAMPPTVLVGVDVVANNSSITSTAHFDDFVLCPPLLAYDDFDDGLVDPAWTLVGVGNANQESVVETGGALELTADGATAFYGADNAGFLYRAFTGDFRAEVTVDGSTMTTGGAYRKAGLMVRQSLDAWDVRLLANLVPYWNDSPTETHLQFVAREAYGEPGRLPVATDVGGVPRTVRLAVIRRGDTLSVEYSTDDGTTWIQPTTGLGGSITIPSLLPTLLVGLDMVSNDISTTSTARFDDFQVTP